MQLTELLYGSTGKVVSSICILVILFLMFMITVQLYTNRRKKAYFSLALSLGLVIVQYTIVVVLELSDHHAAATDYIIQLLKVLAFIWINLGIYQLYNPTSRAVKWIAYGTTILAIGLASVHVYELALGGQAHPAIGLPADRLILEYFLLILIVGSAFFIRPFIGQTGKYTFCTGLYLLAHVLHMINTYVLPGQRNALIAIEHYVPVIYYGTLFFIVFNRIVELLQAVYKSSITDGLTGVYNRTYIMNYAQYLVNRKKGAVIFCDIDNFKRLNDTEGHQTGDEVLKSVARIMSDTVNGKGKVGRYGGEEIVAVLNVPAGEVKKTAEQIRRRVEAETPVTVSVGYSKYEDGITVQELMKQADEAMYVSKKTGKNKVTPYSDKIPKMLLAINGQ